MQKLAILQKDKEDANKYEKLATIVSKHYIGEYKLLFEEIYEQMPEEECELVWDTLRMYSAIHASYYKIKNPNIKESQINFYGFDGNDEFKQYEFCKWILNDLHEYSELTKGGDRTDFNSHCRHCEKYRAMLNKWRKKGEIYELTENDIKDIISV